MFVNFLATFTALLFTYYRPKFVQGVSLMGRYNITLFIVYLFSISFEDYICKFNLALANPSQIIDDFFCITISNKGFIPLNSWRGEGN